MHSRNKHLAGLNKDRPGRPHHEAAVTKATLATTQFVRDILDDLSKKNPATADQAICGLLGWNIVDCARKFASISYSSRGTYLAEYGMPNHFPAVLPPATYQLATGGFVTGEVIELRSIGSYRHSGYWGLPGLARGSIAVFANGVGGTLPKGIIGPQDPGNGEVGPFITGICPDNLAEDNPNDFFIPAGVFQRVKVPAGATHLYLSVPDCFHGDNIGTMVVEIRKVL